MGRKYPIPTEQTIMQRLADMRGADPYHVERLHPLILEKLRRPGYNNDLTAYLIIQEMDKAIDRYEEEVRISVPGPIRSTLLMQYLKAIFKDRRLIREGVAEIALSYPVT